MSGATLAGAFVAGLVSGLSPCTLPTVLVVVGLAGGSHASTDRHRWWALGLSGSFVLGTAATLALLGATASGFGMLFSATRDYVRYGAAAICLLMGLSSLGVFRLEAPVSWRPTLRRGSGLAGAFLLGVPFGILGSPCTLPVVASLLGWAAVEARPAWGALMLLVFGIARGVPLVVVGTSAGALKGLGRVQRWRGAVERTIGAILIALSVYLLVTA